jgi:hypothetical protein
MPGLLNTDRGFQLQGTTTINTQTNVQTTRHKTTNNSDL